MTATLETLKVSPSLKTLTHGLIDYAGLFPPASLPMAAAATNYRDYLAGPNAWMLGRFIVPASRLLELETALNDIPHSSLWNVSALVGSDDTHDVELVRQFNQRSRSKAIVDSVERKSVPTNAPTWLGSLPREIQSVYFEVAPDASPELLSSIRQCGARAKVRAGGATPDAIPPTREIAQFMVHCASTGIAFKATAGLHHPLRADRPLTYEPNAPVAKMHGFLNFLFAAALAFRKASLPIVADALDDESASHFTFSDAGIRWQSNDIPLAEIQTVRDNFAISVGSCSFEEPISDLREWPAK